MPICLLSLFSSQLGLLPCTASHTFLSACWTLLASPASLGLSVFQWFAMCLLLSIPFFFFLSFPGMLHWFLGKLSLGIPHLLLSISGYVWSSISASARNLFFSCITNALLTLGSFTFQHQTTPFPPSYCLFSSSSPSTPLLQDGDTTDICTCPDFDIKKRTSPGTIDHQVASQSDFCLFY